MIGSRYFYSTQIPNKEYVMPPSHPMYPELHSILVSGGETFRKITMEKYGLTKQDLHSLEQRNIQQIHPKIWELGNTGWISKSYNVPGEEPDPHHLLRVQHSYKSRKVTADFGIKLEIPVKFLIEAPTGPGNQFFLVYKKKKLMNQESYTSFLQKNREALRSITEIVAKFSSYTGYMNIHQKNFCLTTEGDLALVDTEERHYLDTDYPRVNKPDKPLYELFDFMSSPHDPENANVFFLAGAREVFRRYALQFKPLNKPDDTSTGTLDDTSIDISSTSKEYGS